MEYKSTIVFLVLSFLIAFSGCREIPPPQASASTPDLRQLEWHDMQYYAFIHFSINTFTNKEWGDGAEMPELFNPTHLDTRQWAKVCKDAGMKGIIITAKHHDGFCLWPTKYTAHSVKNSPWRNGNGDLIKELSEACKEYGLKMGIYISPWDRNHADYGKPEYVTYFRNQLTELLTNYGDIFEVWFDGANGGTGFYGGANEERRVDKQSYYDWENTHKHVYDLQPNTLIFSDAGPDIRWCGNEKGFAGETNWATITNDTLYPGKEGIETLLNTGHEIGTKWIPAEVDVSIRPGWYYHPEEDDKVKTKEQLLEIYFKSVGRGANLLLNLPVDRRGLVHENDVHALLSLKEELDEIFRQDVIINAKASADNYRGNFKKFHPSNVLDGNKNTFWATDDDILHSSLEVELEKEKEIDVIVVKEYLPLGQRIKAFSVEAKVNGLWEKIYSGTTIGSQRMIKIPKVTTQNLRLNIEDAKEAVVISSFEAYQ